MPEQEYKPYAITFNSKGVNIRGTPDTIDISEYANATNWTTDREGAIRSRLGSVLLNTGGTVGIGGATDVHTLFKLGGTTAYRYAVSSNTPYRAATPFTTYAPIVPGAVWIPGIHYKVGDIVVPTLSASALGMFYRCTVAGTSGTVMPSFPSSGTIPDNGVTWTTVKLSGNPMLMTDYAIGIDTRTWAIAADANVMLKDVGGTPELLGIVPADTAPVPTVAAIGRKDIESFQTDPATPGYWTTSSCTLTQDTIYPVSLTGTSYTKSVKVAITGAATAGLLHSVTLDLSTFGSVAITDADFEHVFIYADVPQNITEILLQISIGDTTFYERYEKAIAPSSLLAGMNFTTSTHTATQADATTRLNVLDNIDGGGNTDALQEFAPEQMEPGPNIWTEVNVPRSEVSKVASSDTAKTWADVKAINIQIKTSGTVNVWFDQWAITGGGNLDGDTYLWKFVYRNATTGQNSDVSPASTAFATGAGPSRQSVAVTGYYSRDPQVDKIDVYRLGGTALTYRLSGSATNLPSATTDTFSYADNVLDTNLGASIETDNQRPSNFTGIELHQETLFGWGATGDPPNMLRMSKRVNVEEWPSANYIFVGSGGDKIIRVISNGQQLRVFTLADVYEVYGSDITSYNPVSTGYARGVVDNSFALSPAPGRVYHADYDGIYDFPTGRKISQMIDGVFHGQTINGITPINTSYLSAIRMEFYDSKLHVLYPSGSATSNDAEMVYDILYERWDPSDRAGRTLLYEPDTKILLMGTTAGNVYQIERGTSDSGTAIGLNMKTKFIDLNLPDQDKIWGDLALDIDTGGQDVSVQLNFNNGDTSDTAVTVSTASRSQVQVPISDGDGVLALNCQIALTGSVTSQVTLFKAIPRILIEPPRRRTYVTNWTDDGSAGRKEYRTLALELDTLDSDGVCVDLQLDGSSTAVQTWSDIQTTGRQLLYYGLTPATRGSLRRLRFYQTTDSLTSVFKLYSERLDAIQLPMSPDIWQTDWTDKGYPYDKYWKEVLLELDTFGESRTVAFLVDQVTQFSFNVNTTGRTRITQSLPADIIGKLARVQVTGGSVALYPVDYVVQNDPPDVTRADSLEQTFGTDRWKQLKRVWFAIKARAAVTVNVYCDERLGGTITIPVSTLATGWSKEPYTLPPTIKGKLIRFVLTSSLSFKVYFEQSECESKPVGGQRGYQRVKFNPPQLM